MKLKITQVDAFARTIFEGNPAAVCILESWLPDMVMQAIAGEMNLAETAFLVKRDDGYRIRWFTPTHEVKLCGHATLASAHVLYESKRHQPGPIRFRSLSGVLTTRPLDSGEISMDFPAKRPTPVDLSHEIQDALGGDPIDAYGGEDLIVAYSDPTEVNILSPDFAKIAKLPYRAVSVTAPGNGNGYDFVSRCFAPAVGVNEDPVTGSAFTELGPYYQAKTGKSQFKARQVSKRGGDVGVMIEGDRAHISGSAITVMEAYLYLPDL